MVKWQHSGKKYQTQIVVLEKGAWFSSVSSFWLFPGLHHPVFWHVMCSWQSQFNGLRTSRDVLQLLFYLKATQWEKEAFVLWGQIPPMPYVCFVWGRNTVKPCRDTRSQVQRTHSCKMQVKSSWGPERTSGAGQRILAGLEPALHDGKTLPKSFASFTPFRGQRSPPGLLTWEIRI